MSLWFDRKDFKVLENIINQSWDQKKMKHKWDYKKVKDSDNNKCSLRLSF